MSLVVQSTQVLPIRLMCLFGSPLWRKKSAREEFFSEFIDSLTMVPEVEISCYRDLSLFEYALRQAYQDNADPVGFLIDEYALSTDGDVVQIPAHVFVEISQRCGFACLEMEILRHGIPEIPTIFACRTVLRFNL